MTRPAEAARERPMWTWNRVLLCWEWEAARINEVDGRYVASFSGALIDGVWRDFGKAEAAVLKAQRSAG